MSMPQSQNFVPPIMVSRRTNKHLELEGSSHRYSAEQLRNTRVPTEDRMVGDGSMVLTEVSNETLAIFRQQIDHSSHEMVNTLTNHMTSILNPMLRTTNEIYQQMNEILSRIADVLAIHRNQLANRPIIHGIPINEQWIENNQHDLGSPQVGLANEGGQPAAQNSLLVNINQNANEAFLNVQHNQLLRGQNIQNGGLGHVVAQNPQIDQMIEQALNRHGFKIGYAHQPYFVSSFLDYVLQSKLPRDYKILKF